MVIRELINQFIKLFRNMPNRAAGTYTEQKSAQILEHLGKSLFQNREITTMPFASDISSGSWNVALHSLFYLLSVLLSILAGFLIKLTSTEFGCQTRLGFIGDIPVLFLILSFICCLLIILSRCFSIYMGWSIFSFFIPNTDSANIIFFHRSLLDCRHETQSKNNAKDKLIIFLAHYDTARCLPSCLMPSSSAKNKLITRVKKFTFTKILVALSKNGLSVFPNIALWSILIILGLHILRSYFVLSSLFSCIYCIFSCTSTVFLIVFLIIIVIEFIIAKTSSNLPYNPGFNDNLSGVSVLFGLLGRYYLNSKLESDRFPQVIKALKRAIERFSQTGTNPLAIPSRTDLLFLFTGTEESGLRGAKVFRKQCLKKLVKQYGIDKTFIINIDSVSGETINFFTKEIDLLSRSRGGRQEFAESCIDFLNKSGINLNVLKRFLKLKEINLFFSKHNNGLFYPKVRLSPKPLQSCTDMSGLCVGKAFYNKLNIFSIVSTKEMPDKTIPLPRDYHQLSDTYEAMIDTSMPANMGSIFFLIYILPRLIKGIDNGSIS